MNRENLEKLASYLEGLPADYQHFEMASYFSNNEEEHHPKPYAATGLGNCGTVACAIGHGPAAGIAPTGYENWDEYSDRVFPMTTTEWSWCFSSRWSQTDNTPHGAAKRIRHMLEHGVPADGYKQRTGYAPYMFAKETAA